MKTGKNILRWVAIIPAVVIVFAIAYMVDYLIYLFLGFQAGVHNGTSGNQLIVLLVLGAYEGYVCTYAAWHIAPNHKRIGSIIGALLAFLINLFFCVVMTKTSGICFSTIITYISCITCLISGIVCVWELWKSPLKVP